MHRLCILHRLPLDESDWLLTVFSRQSGKQRVVTPQRRSQTELELNAVYEADWNQAGDWPRIYAVRCIEQWQLHQNALLCSLYLNELLTRLLNESEPFPELYQRYEITLAALAAGQHPEPWLRVFEYQLLKELGYGFSWSIDCRGAPIQKGIRYTFEPGKGFEPVVNDIPSSDAYPASCLLPLAGQGKPDARSWWCAKRVLRQAIDHILDRPLLSRELFAWRKERK